MFILIHIYFRLLNSYFGNGGWAAGLKSEDGMRMPIFLTTSNCHRLKNLPNF